MGKFEERKACFQEIKILKTVGLTTAQHLKRTINDTHKRPIKMIGT